MTIEIELSEEELRTLVQACGWGFAETGSEKYTQMEEKLQALDKKYFPPMQQANSSGGMK